MKKTLLILAFCFSCLFFVSHDAAYAADSTSASLKKMGLWNFGGVTNIPQLGMVIMSFLGKVIIFASVLGFMVGGGHLVFSAGDEGMVSRGKDIMVASVVGLAITLLSYVIVTLVQTLFYSIGES